MGRAQSLASLAIVSAMIAVSVGCTKKDDSPAVAEERARLTRGQQALESQKADLDKQQADALVLSSHLEAERQEIAKASIDKELWKGDRENREAVIASLAKSNQEAEDKFNKLVQEHKQTSAQLESEKKKLADLKREIETNNSSLASVKSQISAEI